MIEINELTERDKGRWVVYDDGFREPETGRIKSWNAKLVFVVFSCDGNWDRFFDYTAQGCDPRDLCFANEEI